MVDTGLVLASIILLLAFAGIIIGIIVMKRSGGRLKLVVLFLIIALSIFAIQEINGIFGYGKIFLLQNGGIIMDLLQVGISLFIFLAIINFKMIIDNIDRNHAKKDQVPFFRNKESKERKRIVTYD